MYISKSPHLGLLTREASDLQGPWTNGMGTNRDCSSSVLALAEPGFPKQADTKKGARLGSEKPYLSLYLCQIPCTLLLSQCEKEGSMKVCVCVCVYTWLCDLSCTIYFMAKSTCPERKEPILMPGETFLWRTCHKSSLKGVIKPQSPGASVLYRTHSQEIGWIYFRDIYYYSLVHVRDQMYV